MFIDNDFIDDDETLLQSHQWRNKVKKHVHIHIATIVSAVGVKGAVKIKTFTTNPADIANFDFLYTLRPPTTEEVENDGYNPGEEKKDEIKISSISSIKKDSLVAFVNGITSRDEARKIVNSVIYVAKNSLGEKEEGEYFHADLIGLNVFNEKGMQVGVIKNVLNHGAGDILEIANEVTNKTFLHPFSKEFVPSVDLAKGGVKIVTLQEVNAMDE